MTCLAGLGETSSILDAIAESASQGAIRLVVNGKEAMIAFGRDRAEAKSIAQQYEPFGGNTTVKGNATIAWTDQPTDAEATSVEDCLA